MLLPHSLAGVTLAAAVNLDRPGTYLRWSIFTVSVANLVLVAVMVVVFGLALLVRFPHAEHGEPAARGDAPGAGGIGDGSRPPVAATGAADAGLDADTEDPAMWTARVRRRALSLLPPGKLLPDRQPAYVSSWVYVFGVATLVTLGLAIVSGLAIALGGADWWHTNAVGHFFNSTHLWSVELFMAFMVIHLWGKFWMAAWRGRRAMTWVTGVVAFIASILECFTGYLSQSNFDSQWISTNGKDAFNGGGIGAFFGLMNVGQMLLWHVVLLPIVLVAIVGAHVLLVRVRGVAHPLPERRSSGRAARRALARADGAPWRGPTRRYDILKEGAIAATLATILVLLLAGLLSSPDAPPVTVATWAQVAPADFLGTAAAELAGTSETANYGPPYNDGTHSTQSVAGVAPARWFGVTQPVDAAQDFVLGPLAKEAADQPAVRSALARYAAAGAAQQLRWANAYSSAEQKVTFTAGAPSVPRAADGPVPQLLSTELTLARSGALDADLLAQHPFYGTDFTKPLLFLEDGSYFADLAKADHLTGSQWGVMNETGSYPGQPWLWLYTLWYQLPGLRTSTSIDLIAILLTGVATLLLLAVPFVPGVRDIPRLVPLHRLVWRSWYRSQDAAPAGGFEPGATGEVPGDAGT